MNSISVESSSDEDDPYTNSVARLRALKKQRVEEQVSCEKSDDQQVNSKEINSKEINNEETNSNVIYVEDNYEEISYDIQTRSRTVRSRRNKKNTTKVTNRRGRRRLNTNRNNVEVANKENPSLESCKDNVIVVSDDEACKEDDNYEINIKVYWRSNRIDRLSMRRHDTFKGIFEYYANLEKVSVSEVLIMKKDKVINHSDTPASLKLSIIDILDGGIVNPGMNTLSKDESNNKTACTIKVQTANKKQSFTIPLEKYEQFKIIFDNCARQIGVKESNLKLYFDGEQISPSDTPESLDLEGEACVDLYIST